MKLFESNNIVNGKKVIVITIVNIIIIQTKMIKRFPVDEELKDFMRIILKKGK